MTEASPPSRTSPKRPASAGASPGSRGAAGTSSRPWAGAAASSTTTATAGSTSTSCPTRASPSRTASPSATRSPQRRRRHLHRRHRPRRHSRDHARHGPGRGGLRQRRPARPLRHGLRRAPALAQPAATARCGTRRHRRARPAAAVGDERGLLRLRRRRPARPLRRELSGLRSGREAALRPDRRAALLLHRRFAGFRRALSQQRRRQPSRTRPPARDSRAQARRGWAWSRPTSTTMAAWTSSRPTTPLPTTCCRNRGDGTFANVALEAEVAYDPEGRAMGAMGVDVDDQDGDGLLDIFVTNFTNQANQLFRGRPAGAFRDVARDARPGRGQRAPERLRRALPRLRQRRAGGSARRQRTSLRAGGEGLARDHVRGEAAAFRERRRRLSRSGAGIAEVRWPGPTSAAAWPPPTTTTTATRTSCSCASASLRASFATMGAITAAGSASAWWGPPAIATRSARA